MLAGLTLISCWARQGAAMKSKNAKIVIALFTDDSSKEEFVVPPSGGSGLFRIFPPEGGTTNFRKR
jgi:hypothetical protein